MAKANPYDIIDHTITYGVKKEVLHLYTEDEELKGNHIQIQGRQLVNFGSCSYLGLEFDERLKQGAINAINQYGTQFSESRAYVSIKLYKEAEYLLEQIFGSPCIITPTTTLGHIANIPVLVGNEDAVIMDHQVHSSVQMAVTLVKARNVHVEFLRHNRLDLLEERLMALGSRYTKIWYMADGIYSMFGDSCPVDDIYRLLEKYEALHYYVDDAHGLSIWGANGKGYVLNNRKIHPRMVLATSLAKSFATGGAVMVYPDRETARRVRTCGGPLITSGPLQPSALGAIIAAAKIHLSDEIYVMQDELKIRIDYTKEVIKRYNLPVVSDSEAGIFFIGVGLPKLGYAMIRKMLDKSFYVNLGIFPAVSLKNTGIRFTITRLHTFQQIDQMVQAMAQALSETLAEENYTLQQIYQAFKIEPPTTQEATNNGQVTDSQVTGLGIQHCKSVQNLDKRDWDRLFSNSGTFDSEGLQTLEMAFTGNKEDYNNWIFDYIIIRDEKDTIVLATFLTTALWKDDMLSSDIASMIIEKARQSNPYYLTSRVIGTGSLLSEGEHFYIDTSHSLWKEAMQLFFEKVSLLQEEYKANSIVVRDFHSIRENLDNLMTENGFVRIPMPETYIRDDMNWTDTADFYNSLTKRSRQHFREDIRKYHSYFETEIIQNTCSEAESHLWYSLYLQVKKHSYALNTFNLPKNIFSMFLQNNKWEIIQLTLHSHPSGSSKPVVVSFILCYRTPTAYIPMLIGIDYAFNSTYNVYRQALYQIIMRAKALGKENILFGFAAGTEKKKLGARECKAYAYMQSKDTYNVQVIESLNTGNAEMALRTVKVTEQLS